MADGKRDPRERERELDDFWDISALIPPKKPHPTRPPSPVTVSEITVEAAHARAAQAVADAMESVSEALSTPQPHVAHEALSRAQTALTDAHTRLTHAAPPQRKPPAAQPQPEAAVIKRYIPPHTPDAAQQTPPPQDEYIPEAAMLHRVRIYRWNTTYQYYEDFCRHATALHERHGEPCAPVPFFSYVPQYTQMNRAQLAWYLYWREQMRSGTPIPTDYSYILLYAYEIINLSDVADVHVGQAQLCLLREAFAATYPRLGHLLGEWICDYSLIHHLPPPACRDLSTFADCTLKEFYVPDTTAVTDRYAASLMAFASNYHYTKSKFATGDNRALYDTHMLGALRACVADGGEVGARMAGAGAERSTLIRDAYTGALCSHRIKRRIRVDYCSFARSHELRILVTDIMKYTENKLRAYLGVKSRLGLYALPQTFRDCIDRYMAAALPARPRVQKAAPRQAYEALYDVPQTTFSPARAAEIEADSWRTTDRLIAAFDEAADPAPATYEPPPAPQPEPAPAPMPESNPAADLPAETVQSSPLAQELGDLMAFVNLALCGDAAGQRELARARGEMMDSIADRINEIAAETIGDILLEECDGAYTVIEDYRSMLAEATDTSCDRKDRI